MLASILGPVLLVFWCLFVWTALIGWTVGWIFALVSLLAGTVAAISTIVRRARYQRWVVTANWVMLVVSAASVVLGIGYVLVFLSIIGLHGGSSK